MNAKPRTRAYFHERTHVDAHGCWVWDRWKCHQGYGRASIGGGSTKTVVAHRVAYEVFVGPIPEGLTLDHLCRNRACVNPYHMDPVTHRVNILRGEGACARNARKTHCKRGHEFTPENTYWSARGRGCLTCRREADRKRYERRTQLRGVA